MNDQHEPAQHQASSTRGPDGRYTRSLETAERDAEAARLRSRGWSYRQIAVELDVDVATAHSAVQRALKATVEEPAAEVRQLELARLDFLWEQALAVLEAEHVHVSGGNVVTAYVTDDDGNLIIVGRDDGGKPIFKEKVLVNDAPKLKAIETMLKIQARRAALQGLDTPVKADITVHQVDPADTALAELINEAKARVAAEEAQLRGGSE